MNEYDSQQMAQILHEDYELTGKAEDADLILVNTCSIREKAENKVYSLVGRFKRLKEDNPCLVIGVTGCVAQQEREKILKRAPFVDMVLGPQGIPHLPRILQEVEEGMGPVCFAGLSRDYCVPNLDAPLPEPDPVRAFVTIMQGCDNFCTYCVVPYVRGRETSRPAGDVVSEVARVVEQGAKDVTLLGQNVNSYGKKASGFPSFARLLEMCSRVQGLLRLRFTTSHPKDLTPDVMECFRDLPNLCEHLHLPVQSGSSRILRSMNRHYTRDEYLCLVDRLRELCPEITLTTDLIVGFPGETEEDFEQTLSLLEAVQFDQIFAFKYSSRPFTKAARFPGQVPEDIKARRLAQVLELQKEIGLKRYRLLEGKRVEVLVEGVNKANPRELTARTRGNHVVNLPGPPELVGRMVEVTIERACLHSLRGLPAVPSDKPRVRSDHGIDPHVCTFHNP